MLTILFCMQKTYKQTACDLSQEHKYSVDSFILNYFTLFHESHQEVSNGDSGQEKELVCTILMQKYTEEKAKVILFMTDEATC